MDIIADTVRSFKNLESYVHSYRALISEKGSDYSYVRNELVLKEIGYDLFFSTTPSPGKFCSSRFKEVIEEEGFTGIQFVRWI